MKTAVREFVNRFFHKSMHRRMLESLIEKNTHSIKGRVLELGSKNRRYDHLFTEAEEIVASDVRSDAALDVVEADVRALPFDKESFDTVIAFEVFEYIIEMDKALHEATRVLRPGGMLIFSVPFLCSVHGTGEADDIETDILRYTSKGWRMLLQGKVRELQIISFGDRWKAMYDFWFSWCRSRKSTSLKLALIPLCLILKGLIGFIDKGGDAQRYVMGYYIVCKK